MPADDPTRFRELLTATHVFPGSFPLSVITVNDDAAVEALRAAIGDTPPDGWITRQSSRGRYTSHRVLVHCESADDVLALYARVRLVRGVVTVL